MNEPVPPAQHPLPARPPGPTLTSFLALPIGTRVVVRYEIPGGATDVLGLLKSFTQQQCEITTSSGDVTVALARIIAGKQIPPPPVRRVSR